LVVVLEGEEPVGIITWSDLITKSARAKQGGLTARYVLTSRRPLDQVLEEIKHNDDRLKEIERLANDMPDDDPKAKGVENKEHDDLCPTKRSRNE
jgi:hypothetical protein